MALDLIGTHAPKQQRESRRRCRLLRSPPQMHQRYSPSSKYSGPSNPTLQYTPSSLKNRLLHLGRPPCSSSALVTGDQDNAIDVEVALSIAPVPSGNYPSAPSQISPIGDEGVSIGTHSDKLNKIGHPESTDNSKTSHFPCK